MNKRGKMPQPEPRLCRDCEHWKIRVCINPRSDKFTDTTSADDGCTPHKRAKGGWI